MNNFFKKIFKHKKKITSKEKSFLRISEKTKVNKIFKAISEHDDLSEVRYVGGCVRKILNNEEFDDIDLATNINPELVKNCLKKNNINFFETGLIHGTITANIDKKNFEITSLRKDLSTDGRHAVVKFTDNWIEDSNRRDFTFNAIYSDEEGNLFDPHNGLTDLKNGLVKFIGNPETRIKEDYLRILRYVRFFLNYSKVDHKPEVISSLKKNINGVIKLSKERLLDELKKLVMSKNFIKLQKDNISKEIITTIFPQIINLNLFKNLNKYSKTLLKDKDFIFILSLLIIDDTDNSSYFLYKFNLSNDDKKRIIFLKKINTNSSFKEKFSKKNLNQILYFYGKFYLMDMIDFHLLKSNKINKKLVEIKKYYQSKEKPLFPLKANDLMHKYNLKEGVLLGSKLKELEKLWIKNNFNISNKEIDKVMTD